MIELKIDGICKECYAIEPVMFETADGWKVFCKHESVCKYIGDPDAKERMRAAIMAHAERVNNEID